MKPRHFIMIGLFSLTSLITGCSSIIATVTGDEPIGENPSARTIGSMIEDQSIETKILVNLKKAFPDRSQHHFSITSFDSVVLMTGQVPSEEDSALAQAIASRVQRVSSVHNELTVAGPLSHVARSNDAWLSTKIRSRLLLTEGFPSSRVKVITEDGIVYLLGILSEDEAHSAVQIVRQVYGVQKIVKIIQHS